MRNGMIRKLFLTFSGVQLITYLITVLGNIVDGVVTGRFLGTEALAAYGLVTPFLTIMTAVATALSIGTSTLLSNKLGMGALNEMRSAFRICLWTVLLVSTVLGVCIIILASPLATAFKAEGEIHEMAVSYLRGYAIGLPPIFIVSLAMPIMQIIGRRPILIISTIVTAMANVAGDFVNVLLLHGGMFGMGLATSISYYAAITIILITIARSDMFSIMPTSLNGTVIKDMVIYGAPNAVSMGSRNILTLLLNFLIISIAGVKMIAAYSAIMSSINLVMAISAGFASAVSVLTGVFSGEKDRHDLVALIKTAIAYSVIAGGICIIAFMVFSGGIVSLFLKDETLLADASLGLRLVVANSILFSINFCIRSYYQAMKMKIAIPFAVFNGMIGTLICAYTLGHLIGIAGVWLAYPVGELLTLLIFGAYAFRKTMETGHSPIERYMMIPDDYYGDVEPIEINVSSVENVMEASQNVGVYMKKHGAQSRIALYASLAVEELACNIVKYGFKGGKHYHLTVKLKKNGEQWILRLRDDCRAFDPVAYVKTITREQKACHYGIRMIYGLADEVKYLNTLNLNNLTICFK